MNTTGKYNTITIRIRKETGAMKRKISFFVLFSVIMFVPECWVSAQHPNLVQEGLASYYADKFQGKTTASGEKYYHEKATAAHKTLPFGTIVKVTNLENNTTTAVRINDRGPHKPGRIIDLSRSVARKLGFLNEGVTKVRIEAINRIEGKDYHKPSSKPSSSKTRNIYSFNMRRTQPEGFAIQLGSFRKMQNLINASASVDHLERSKFHFEIAEKSSNEIYRLLYGFFDQRNRAEEIKSRLHSEFPGCFVVEF
jgi:rare lipoprotein A